MKGISLYILVGLVARSHGGANYGSQVVLKFPEGVWQSNTCNSEHRKRLPEKCYSALTPDSTKAEQIACSIISTHKSNRKIPMEMFPMSFDLGADISNFGDSSLTPIFDDCALEKMIADGCVTFMRNVWGGEYNSNSYVSSASYSSLLSESFGIDASASAGFGPVAVSVSMQQKNAAASTESTVKQSSGFTQIWRNEIGTLSFGDCAFDYINEDLKDKWEYIKNNNQKHDAVQMAEDPYFQKLASMGYYFPISYGFSVQYKSSVEAVYEETSSTASSEMSRAITAGINASFASAGVSASTAISSAISSSDAAKSVNAKVHASDSTLGECDFAAMLENDGSDWSNKISECAQAAADNSINIPKASHIPRGGFRSVAQYLEAKGLNINTPSINAAFQILYGQCTSEEVKFDGFRNVIGKYTCRFADGGIAYQIERSVYDWKDGKTIKTVPWVTKKVWRLLDDRMLQEDFYREKIMDTLCAGYCTSNKGY